MLVMNVEKGRYAATPVGVAVAAAERASRDADIAQVKENQAKEPMTICDRCSREVPRPKPSLGLMIRSGSPPTYAMTATRKSSGSSWRIPQP